mgnify:CR=1 FL=1
MRKKVIALGVAVLVVIALWAAAWFWAAGTLHDSVLALALNDGES